ncbi:hypothetical protein V2J09_002331 [Rumex salicifolius]
MTNLQVEATAIVVDQPATKNKPVKSSAGDAKPKKATAKKPSTHPPFYEMVSDAIVTLKEKSGSSQYAIQKFVEEKHKQLPLNFRKLLLTQLKKFAASGKLVKVKNSYKLPSTIKATAVPKPATKKSSVATKPKPKTVSKVVTKAKTADKPKSVVLKPKAVAAKRKDVKPKAKPAKVAKKSAASSPSSKKVPAKATKKVAVSVKKAAAKPKKVKRLSSVKSPAKRMSARKAAK